MSIATTGPSPTPALPPTQRRMSVEQLEREGTPEGRWELIDGELVEMSPSSSESSGIGVNAVSALHVHVRSHQLGRVFGADGGFRVVVDGVEMVRAADAAFVRADRLPPGPHRGFLPLAPDLVVEVVSPSDLASEVLAKARMWLAAGARLVWVADPPSRTVTVYRPDGSAQVVADGGELYGGDVLPGFRLPLADLYA